MKFQPIKLTEAQLKKDFEIIERVAKISGKNTLSTDSEEEKDNSEKAVEAYQKLSQEIEETEQILEKSQRLVNEVSAELAELK